MDATNSDSSRILLSRLLSNLAATRNPYEVWTEKARHLRAAGRTTCEAYIVLAQDVLSLLDWQHDGDSVWDRQGHYLVFTLSPVKDLHQLAALHLLKASDVYFFVYVTLFYPCYWK
ncbi:uncharacterized protein LOC135101149 [Scylla paramamosain]|uniref:uncharacterized protein LOC135101149 n=1 Tax=Scylla paramamosain TaxID=85552 RepID=UPI003082C8E8